MLHWILRLTMHSGHTGPGSSHRPLVQSFRQSGHWHLPPTSAFCQRRTVFSGLPVRVWSVIILVEVGVSLAGDGSEVHQHRVPDQPGPWDLLLPFSPLHQQRLDVWLQSPPDDFRHFGIFVSHHRVNLLTKPSAAVNGNLGRPVAFVNKWRNIACKH